MDGMTLLEAQEVKESQNWDLIKKEIRYRISLKTNELRSCSDQRILDRINSAIDTLESVLLIPEDVIDREQ